MGVLYIVLFCVSASLINATEYNKLNNFLFSGDYEFFDLTFPFDNSSIYWPDSQKFKFTKKTSEIKEDASWYATNDFEAGEHGGTHLDAPYHFDRTGAYVGDIPLEKLIVPLIIVDIGSQVNDDPNFVLYKHNLDNLLNDNFGKPCILIFKFGWSKFYYNRNQYLGVTHVGLNFPGLSFEVAEWIAKTYKNIVGIGVDVASVDPGSSKDFRVHKTLLKAGIYNLENVNLSIKIPEYGCTALVLPMKIAMGTGAPLRLVAICPKQNPESF